LSMNTIIFIKYYYIIYYVRAMPYPFNDETEKLQNLETELKSIITVIEAEQKTLKEEIKIVGQKVAIRELLKSVRKRRNELDGLPVQRAKREE